jgi:hypothetical protein
MDTDDLSENTYQAIIAEAEHFNHDLTLQFGLLPYYCSNESEYIQKSIALVKQIKKMNKGEIDDMFFKKLPKKKELIQAVNRILDNIKSLDKQK